MTTNRHSTEFQEQALSKARQRGTRSVQDVANDLNMPVGTLRKWLSKSNRKGEVGKPVSDLPVDLPAQSWSPAQRLLALNQTHGMPETQLHAWCREKGLFEHQLKAWGEAFCSATVSESREARTALRELAKLNTMDCSVNCAEKRRRWRKLQPWLVLQKKFQALWEDEER